MRRNSYHGLPAHVRGMLYCPTTIDLIEKQQSNVEALCREHRVKRLELFGSATRGDFDPNVSDLDFFVEFEPMGWQTCFFKNVSYEIGKPDIQKLQYRNINRYKTVGWPSSRFLASFLEHECA